ncbi:MAG: ABC transporter ATP-binding protein [Desulfurococcales archaeon]|nr:ABC transporter ATP-binding protein [Desulfurococcales archaeon]
MVEVELRGVWKVFGRVAAVRDVNLRFPDGKFSSILGPSGSGKSTLLYLIAGIYRPTRGEVLFDGRDVSRVPPNERNVGLVFQNYALYPHMTVFDNIAFPLRLRKTPRGEVERRVREVAEMLGIGDLLDRYPAQLSGGQQQRVALARALVKRPSVLLLDEPLSNLDALVRLRIRGELKRLQQELGITAIYVTHDQSEALAMSDQIAVIHRGEIQQVGTPEDVYEKPRNIFVASFIGMPPANLVPAEVRRAPGPCVLLPGGGEYCPRGGLASKLAALGLERVVVAFRPEDAILAEHPLEDYVSMEGEVYVVEPLGRENIVTLSLPGGHSVKVITQPVVSPPAGSRMYINLEPSKIRLFDPETELNIEYLEAPPTPQVEAPPPRRRGESVEEGEE